MTTNRIPSPIDEMDAPARLAAHVVTPGPQPLLHGFDVQNDLARSYDFAEVVYTALTGEPPSETTGRVFNVLLTFLAPISVAEAPCHATVLARLVGARTAGLVSTAAIGLAEQARAEPGPPPTSDSKSVERLKAALREAGVSRDGNATFNIARRDCGSTSRQWAGRALAV